MVTRLYTGFERSLKEGVWQPEGVPTVYNFINRASKKYNLTVVLTCKDSGKTYSSNWDSDRDQKFFLKGLDSPVIALAGVSFFGHRLPRKLAMMMRLD